MKIGWRPADFWKATLSEFFDAVDAFNEMHADHDAVEAPTKDEMADLLSRYGGAT